MRRRLITLTAILGFVLAGVFARSRQPSSGQGPDPIRKQPACTVFCGDGSFNTFKFANEPCWGGPLPANRARDHFKELSEKDRAASCEILKATPKQYRECPAFKILAALCNPKCKEPYGPSEDHSPWFDPSDAGCQDLQDTRMNANWSTEGGGTCILTLTACNSTALTLPVRYLKEGPLALGSGDMTPQEGYRRITRSECTPQLYGMIWGDYPGTVCCDLWREGVGAGGSCNPQLDADCDGLPNDRDPWLNSQHYYAPPRPGSVDAPPTPGWVDTGSDKKPPDFDPANFDPRPPGMSWDEVMPREPCKLCKWIATSAKLTCSPDGRTEHEYKVTWVCPSSGAQRTVTKRAPASAPCTPPQRRR